MTRHEAEALEIANAVVRSETERHPFPYPGAPGMRVRETVYVPKDELIVLATALASQSSQLSALSDELEKVKAALEIQIEATAFADENRTFQIDRAERAEAALSSLRARVREVVGPFAAFIAAVEDNPSVEWGDDAAITECVTGRRVTGADLRAARQLVEDMGE